ncbi:nucleoid-associated protein [Citrobacter koseri]|uniref:nucleoid-associated protein n=1 Tax=Citrobacter koseri TaxID=545 RepID=UPI00350FBE7A
MIDISSAKVAKVIVHRVGNKLRDEGFHLSQAECHRSSTLDELLIRDFLAPVVRKGQEYSLTHESDVSLNTINHYANNVFKTSNAFKESSDAIAKHLYSCSGHQNIGGGEFLVILFEGIRSEDQSLQALGLYKVEGKDDYLDVGEEKGEIQIIERVGISLSKVQKGAVIISNGLKVFAIDNLGLKTKYWIENFLKVAPSQTPQKSAQIAGALLKAISNRVETPSNALEFTHQVEELLTETDALSLSDIRKISNNYLNNEEVDELLNGARLKYGVSLDDSVPIESKRLAKFAKEIVTKARIAEGVSLLVSNPDAKIHSIDVKPVKNGYRAVVDIQMKEAK